VSFNLLSKCSELLRVDAWYLLGLKPQIYDSRASEN